MISEKTIISTNKCTYFFVLSSFFVEKMLLADFWNKIKNKARDAKKDMPT